MESHTTSKCGSKESGQMMYLSLFVYTKKENDRGMSGCYNRQKWVDNLEVVGKDFYIILLHFD